MDDLARSDLCPERLEKTIMPTKEEEIRGAEITKEKNID